MAIQPGRFVISLDRGTWWCQHAVIGRGSDLGSELAWLARCRKGQQVMIFDRMTGKTAIKLAEAWPDELLHFCGGAFRFETVRRAGVPA